MNDDIESQRQQYINDKWLYEQFEENLQKYLLTDEDHYGSLETL